MELRLRSLLDTVFYGPYFAALAVHSGNGLEPEGNSIENVFITHSS